jgi:hypothetical protein
MSKEKNSPRVKAQLNELWDMTVRLRILLFLVLLVALYGFIGVRIQTLANAKPSQADIDTKSSTTSKPYIDPEVVGKVQQLQDTSVSVQALFNQARQNPFQE